VGERERKKHFERYNREKESKASKLLRSWKGESERIEPMMKKNQAGKEDCEKRKVRYTVTAKRRWGKLKNESYNEKEWREKACLKWTLGDPSTGKKVHRAWMGLGRSKRFRGTPTKNESRGGRKGTRGGQGRM